MGNSNTKASIIYLRDLSEDEDICIKEVQKELGTTVRTRAVKHMIIEYSRKKEIIEKLEKEVLHMKHQNRLLNQKLYTVKQFFALANNLETM